MEWQSRVALCSEQDRANLAEILSLKPASTPASPDEILEALRWAYHSKLRAKARETLGKAEGYLTRRTDRQNAAAKEELERVYALPSYDIVLREAAKAFDALETASSLDMQEVFLCDAVFAKALNTMSPLMRREALERQLDIEEFARAAGLPGPKLAGPLTAVAALGGAQASGFGVYLAATTTLGFLTHAVGVTLPFAAFTGMTKTIACIIGPAGWLAAGVFSAAQLTGPEWKKLITVIIYLVAVRARHTTSTETIAAKAKRGLLPL